VSGDRTHIRGLDGLRGLAVLAVVVFHLGEGVLHGGYLGVDVFFVLSGYLITSILLSEHERTGRIDLRRFWIRRLRRLSPALLSLLPAIALYAVFLARPEELSALRRQGLATLAYVANWQAIATHRSYWEMFAAPSPLEHTWSLAIEEQFYLLWPLWVLLALGTLRLARRTFLGVTLAMTLASALALWRLYDPEHTERAYFGTDTRAAAILIGAAYAAWSLRPVPAAWARARWMVIGRDVLGALGLLGLALACVRLEGRDPFLYRGGLWLCELATIGLIACSTARGESGVERFLAWAPLRWLGTRSYGIYLWHWPIFCVLTAERVHVAPLALTALRLGATVLVAMVSFTWLERPIREHGLRVRRPVLVGAASFALAGALVVVSTRGAGAAAAPAQDESALVAPAASAGPVRIDADVHTLPLADALSPGTVRVLVLGDSVAQAVGRAMRARQADRGIFVAERGVGDCSIMESRKDLRRGQELGHPDPTHGCAATWVADVNELRPDVTLVVVGGAFMTPMTIDKKKVQACDPGWQEFYRARLDQLAREMGEAAGRLVFATTAPPGPRWRERETLAWVGCLNAALTTVAAARQLPVIDLAEHLCPQGECRLLEGDAPIRPDGLHPAGVGAEPLADWLLHRLVQPSWP